jgi:hypothetical protein
VVDELSLKDEIYQVAHNWPIPVLAFIIGSFIGWGLSFVFPPTYQAEVEFILSYNDMQACRNPDDCKNWQLAQMDAFAKSGTILEPTLFKLQSMDDYWIDVSTEDLSEMLDVLWRNTGNWRFIAKSSDPKISEVAVETWAEVYLKEFQIAREHAFGLFDLNARIIAINQNQVQLTQKLFILNSVQNELKEFRTLMGSRDLKEPLNKLERWKLYDLAAQAAGNDFAWLELIDSIPSEMAPLSSYLLWIDRLEISVIQDIQATNNQLEQLHTEAITTLDKIAIETESSHGLSQIIELQRFLDGQPKVEVTRRSTTTAVLGGILGLLIWGLIRIAFPIWHSRT